MTLPPSSSDGTSSAFHQLHPAVQRWLWAQGWEALRDAQEVAIPVVLAARDDVIIAATTASGKTEAAFLPICSNLAREGDEDDRSVVLYVSPLKALINDQFRRLADLCAELEIPVHPWHGDIGAGRKQAFRKQPFGVLLITPESLEALLMNSGSSIQRLFGHLKYVVVDELHAFIGAERGRQLQSLLHRVELAIGRTVPRVGLSATLGDMGLAADFLRPNAAAAVQLIVSNEGRQELLLQIRGYLDQAPSITPAGGADDGEVVVDDGGAANEQIADEMFRVLRGSNNLVFANSRRNVELFTDKLRTRCERLGVPNEFWAHHGNLSRNLREELEAALKKGDRPVSAVCTSTLEMGIDIGAVKSVAQVGAPHSVASLRQRLGRSGRRGDPAILRFYVAEPEVTAKTPLLDRLRLRLFQSVAMVELLLARWCEPPVSGGLHLSTLVHQILSVIAQHGGATAERLWRTLCAAGPFGNVDQAAFVALLRQMGRDGLIMQASDGLLLHGEAGEVLVNHYSFYPVFMSDIEYRLASGSRTLGTVPVDCPIQPGDHILFAGRRWQVSAIDEPERVIEVAPARAGKALVFGGEGGQVHDRVRQAMRALYQGEEAPRYLDAMAQRLLAEGRRAFRDDRLDAQQLLQDGSGVLLFTWAGDRTNNAIVCMLKDAGINAFSHGPALHCEAVDVAGLEVTLRDLAARETWDAAALTAGVANKQKQKFDPYLPEALLARSYASSELDVAGAMACLRDLIG